MPTIDLNADLGEGGSQDTALIQLASSVNIACGGHAGDDSTMRTSIRAALAAHVAIGAHPGYEDPENFGRLPLDLPPSAITALIHRQLTRFADIASQEGAEIHHVKPHGALYHQADRDPALATAIAQAVAHLLPGTALYAPPSGALAAAAQAAGLTVTPEGFADRRYQQNGTLVPRSEPHAVIEDIQSAVAQALQIARDQHVTTHTGTTIPLPARTLCVHGDTPHSVQILRAVRTALETSGFKIRA